VIGEISISGVYVPALLLHACVAIVLVWLLSRLSSTIGVYRLLAYRPLADIALFVLLLAAIAWLTEDWGLQP
jgi:hypothetical protein